MMPFRNNVVRLVASCTGTLQKSYMRRTVPDLTTTGLDGRSLQIGGQQGFRHLAIVQQNTHMAHRISLGKSVSLPNFSWVLSRLARHMSDSWLKFGRESFAQQLELIKAIIKALSKIQHFKRHWSPSGIKRMSSYV